MPETGGVFTLAEKFQPMVYRFELLVDGIREASGRRFLMIAPCPTASSDSGGTVCLEETIYIFRQ